MRMPRCGNIDVFPGTAQDIPSTRDLIAETELPDQDRLSKKTLVRVKRFTQISRWNSPAFHNDVLTLKWFIEKYTNDIPRNKIRTIVKKAFDLWSAQVTVPSTRMVKLRFVEAESAADADISLAWVTGDHGDNHPFNNVNINILAHTFYPNYYSSGTLNGDIHLDDSKKWVLYQTEKHQKKKVYFPYVIIHEIGHSLGLGHSTKPEAIMNSLYKNTPIDQIVLDVDDRCAVNWNYVGPSDICLYVMVMVELLPGLQKSNATSVNHGFGSIISSDATGNIGSDYSGLSFRERISLSLSQLQDEGVPTCDENTTIPSQFQNMFRQQLRFSDQNAATYGPVICNFLTGLERHVGNANVSMAALQRLRPAAHDTTASAPDNRRLRRKRHGAPILTNTKDAQLNGISRMLQRSQIRSRSNLGSLRGLLQRLHPNLLVDTVEHQPSDNSGRAIRHENGHLDNNRIDSQSRRRLIRNSSQSQTSTAASHSSAGETVAEGARTTVRHTISTTLTQTTTTTRTTASTTDASTRQTPISKIVKQRFQKSKDNQSILKTETLGNDKNEESLGFDNIGLDSEERLTNATESGVPNPEHQEPSLEDAKKTPWDTSYFDDEFFENLFELLAATPKLTHLDREISE